MTVSELKNILEKYDNLGFGSVEIELMNANYPINSSSITKTEFVETSTSDNTTNTFYIMFSGE